MLIIILCLMLTLGYVLLMAAYSKGWAMQDDFKLPPVFQPSTFISVIIPARNESANIGACIDSILAQQYALGLYEIIVVDDHSDDDTAQIVKEYASQNVRYVNLADFLPPGKKITAYKKAAIAAGIACSNGKLIVTTDADCIAPNSWLLHIAALYEQQQPTMIIAPVIYSEGSGILHLFQQIDFISMQGITIAAYSMKLGNMSNGANLAFTKEAFEAVGGYDDIDHIASGDDYLLTMKMNKLSPGGISCLKTRNAAISTAPPPGWYSFLQQRIRWASKSGKYDDKKLTLILMMVYLFNISFLLLCAAGLLYDTLFFYTAVVMLATKTVAEYLFLVPVARFFRRASVLKYFPFLQPLHILYITLAGFLGLIGAYTWKGRKVR